MKIRFLYFLSFWLFSLPAFSQFSTDFSEGNLDVWEGDKSNFIINGNQELQLNAPEGSTNSWLYTPVTFADSTVWELSLKLNFAPSTSNQLKIYLGVSSPDLATASGYYLEIGASGDQDPLELKYLNNGLSESLAASSPGLVSMDPVELTVRVVKKENGDWQVYQIIGITAELLFTTSHNLLPLSTLSVFGFECKYTSTRRDKFFFDDLSIVPLVADTTPPQCLSLNVLNANSLELIFNELLDESSALLPEHYVRTPGNLQPNEVVFNQPNIILTWNDDFISQQEYTLAIQGVKDQAGNASLLMAKNFSYVAIAAAQPYEILITEILADPTPSIGLPEEEYLEIYNASGGVFRLSDYTLQVGSGKRLLPGELINPNSYVILCDAENVSIFEPYGQTVGISSFPGLTNSGASVKILDSDDASIHEVDYKIAWYQDGSKANGGWSLEMKNPMHICSGADNWAASINLSGGTPGIVNSTWDTSPDLEGPELISLYSSSAQTILLRFSENLDQILMENPAAYALDPAITITSAELVDPTTIELTLASSLMEGVIYTFLPFDAFDCLGNATAFSDALVFGVPSDIETGDILINELLFNPSTGGSRFIEIINVSQKFIDLSQLAIGQITSTKNDIYATNVNEILNPGDLAVFSPNPTDIQSRYTVPRSDLLHEAQVPSWGTTSGNASLLSNGVIIDSFTYYSSWHNPAIADQNGVSLERISKSLSSSSSSTWHSASSVSGYATPTGVNSQNTSLVTEKESPYSITNSVFSPDDDGFKDFLALNFLLTTGDFIGSVWVYDLEGREIIQLLSNESLGTSTTVQWDGRRPDQILADMGIYVLFIQLWDAAGNVNEYKETCALVKR